MKKWKFLLVSNGLDLCEVDVNRGISPGDSLSPLIFVICMIPLPLLLRAGIINWKVDELKKMDRTMRKTLTMYAALHPKSDINRLYLKRKYGRRGLISIKTCVRLKEKYLGFYVRKSNEMLLKGIKKFDVVKTENLMEKEDFKKNSQNEFKNKWHEMRMDGQFVREMPEEIDKV